MRPLVGRHRDPTLQDQAAQRRRSGGGEAGQPEPPVSGVGIHPGLRTRHVHHPVPLRAQEQDRQRVGVGLLRGVEPQRRRDLQRLRGRPGRDVQAQLGAAVAVDGAEPLARMHDLQAHVGRLVEHRPEPTPHAREVDRPVGPAVVVARRAAARAVERVQLAQHPHVRRRAVAEGVVRGDVAPAHPAAHPSGAAGPDDARRQRHRTAVARRQGELDGERHRLSEVVEGRGIRGEERAQRAFPGRVRARGSRSTDTGGVRGRQHRGDDVHAVHAGRARALAEDEVQPCPSDPEVRDRLVDGPAVVHLRVERVVLAVPLHLGDRAPLREQHSPCIRPRIHGAHDTPRLDPVQNHALHVSP